MPYVRKTFDCFSCNKRVPLADCIVVDDRPYCPDCQAHPGRMRACYTCTGLVHPEHIHEDNGAYLCFSCKNRGHVPCEACATMIPTTRGRTDYMIDDKSWCQDCFEGLYISCSHCSELILETEACATPHSVSTMCYDCWEELCVECCDCSRIIWNDDAHGYYDYYRCEDCYEDCSDSYYDGWPAETFNPESNSYRRIISRRAYGIELEFTRTAGARRREEALRYFGQISEHCGVEYRSSILRGDKGLTAIETLADYAEEEDWRIARNCGYHLHVDLRDEAPATLPIIAYAYRKTYNVWRRFVSEWRRESSSFCRRPHYTAAEIRTAAATGSRNFNRWMARSERYTFVNWQAYSEHGTIEIRLHPASFDGTEITNWIKAHTRFVDWAVQQTFDTIDETFEGTDRAVAADYHALAAIWGTPGLDRFYRRRARHFGSAIPARTLQTVED